MRLLNIVIIAILLISTAVFADFKAGVSAYKAGDYKTAYDEFLPLAENGNAKAQTILGIMYKKGQDVEQDYSKAIEFYKKAASQGYELAKYRLSELGES